MAGSNTTVPSGRFTPPRGPASEPEPESFDWRERVERALAKLEFGSVTITKHGGRITEIATTEKVRF